MISRRKAWALAAGALVSGRVTAQPTQTDGPFGLTWAASPEQLGSLGIDLKALSTKEFGESFMASNLPKALTDQFATLLSFGHNKKLYRIVALGRRVENDPHGLQVKSRYSELTNILAEKYGQKSSFHRLGDSIYAESRYFLAGIRGGHTFWATEFKNGPIRVQIDIMASNSDTGQWRIFFEHKALEKEASKKSRERGAL